MAHDMCEDEIDDYDENAEVRRNEEEAR